MKIYHFAPLLAAAILVGCSTPSAQYITVEGAMLGTTLRIVADANVSPSELYTTAMRLDSVAKADLSLFDSNSQLSRINSGATDSLSQALAYNIELSLAVSRLSDGAYDITVAPLIKAWGFASAADAVQEPNIDSLLEIVGYQKIWIDQGRLRRSDPRVQIDLNSIAKGYTVDILAEAVADAGAQNYMVDIGGEIHCRGVNPRGGAWRIGIESPIDGNMTNGDYIEKIIAIPPSSPLRAVATSGNYRRYYLDAQGNKVAHTIDPKSGRSAISSLLSVTVLAPTCALADAYSTMFMAVGSQGAIELASRLDDCEVYFIFAADNDQYSEYLSPGMESFVVE